MSYLKVNDIKVADQVLLVFGYKDICDRITAERLSENKKHCGSTKNFLESGKYYRVIDVELSGDIVLRLDDKTKTGLDKCYVYAEMLVVDNSAPTYKENKC